MRYAKLCVLAVCTSFGHAEADHELDDRDLAIGEHLYLQHCATCHGKNLEGQPNWRQPGQDGALPAPPHDVNGHTWHHDNQLLFDYTNLGGQAALSAKGVTGFASGMPGFRGALSDSEIWNILAFIRSTWPQEIKDVQSARNPQH